MKKSKFVIISHDAMVYDDLEYLGHKQSFKYLIEGGALVKTFRTIYPTVTYPAHTSMITGCYPDKTGVYNNELDIMGVKSCDWHWFRSSNKAETLLDAAKKKGLVTANVFWPVTGCDKNIDYNIAEYWTQNENETIFDAFRRAGSSEEVIDRIIRPNSHYLIGKERKHPYADDFVFSCGISMIKNFRPDVLVMHPAGIDSLRHSTGVFSDRVNDMLDHTALWVQRVIEAVDEIGELENTNFVMMSDHGQINVDRWAMPNVELCRRGFIRVDEKGNIIDWDAFVKGVGASAQVFLKDESDRATYDSVYKTLIEMCDSGLYGFSEVMTREEAHKRERLSGGFSFVLETDGYTSFGSEWTGKIMHQRDISDYRGGAATHGYLPDKGPQPTMIACGPDFVKGAVVERRLIVDFAPTVAEILGLSLPDVDGCPIEEIIKK